MPARQHQGRPALDVDTAFERQRAIGRDGGVRLRRQQARQDHARAGGRHFDERRGEPLQRPKQNVGEDKVERRPCANALSEDAVRFHDVYECAGPVELRVGAGDAHRFGIDVGCEYVLTQRQGGGDGEHAAAGAEIENAPLPREPRPANPIEREEAAARRAVVASPEGERRLDLDPDPVGRNAGTIMGAVNEKPPSVDWL